MRVTVEHDNGKIETYEVTQEAEFTRVDDELEQDSEEQEREDQPAAEQIPDAVCFLCGSGIIEDGLFCFGCRTFVCLQHPQTPWGRHKPEDHDLP